MFGSSQHVSLKGPSNASPSNPRETSARELIASQIACHKSFSTPLSISLATAPSLRGILLSKHIHSPLVVTSPLKATQRGVKSKKPWWSVHHAREHFLFYFSLNVLALVQRQACGHTHSGDVEPPCHSNCTWEPFNGSYTCAAERDGSRCILKLNPAVYSLAEVFTAASTIDQQPFLAMLKKNVAGPL